MGDSQEKECNKIEFLEAQNEELRQQIQDLKIELQGQQQQLQQRYRRIGFLEGENVGLKKRVDDLKAKLQEEKQQQYRYDNVPLLRNPQNSVSEQALSPSTWALSKQDDSVDSNLKNVVSDQATIKRNYVQALVSNLLKHVV